MNHRTLLLGTLAAVLAASGAEANLIRFDFNDMAYNSTSNPGSNTAVQTYITGKLAGTGITAVVTGAGELSNNQYTGDRHVVGPGTGSTPATLGSTDGGVQGTAALHSYSSNNENDDNYIVNSGADRITITFSKPIFAVAFDYEIFPDGTCPNPGGTSSQNLGCTSTGNANWPDFELWADGIQLFQTFGTLPGSAGTYLHSPVSGSTYTEKTPQYLGISGPLTFANGVTKLEFVDWPQRIGIDNLEIETCCIVRRQVPEPGSLALAGLALAGLAGLRRRSASRR